MKKEEEEEDGTDEKRERHNHHWQPYPIVSLYKGRYQKDPVQIPRRRAGCIRPAPVARHFNSQDRSSNKGRRESS